MPFQAESDRCSIDQSYHPGPRASLHRDQWSGSDHSSTCAARGHLGTAASPLPWPIREEPDSYLRVAPVRRDVTRDLSIRLLPGAVRLVVIAHPGQPFHPVGSPATSPGLESIRLNPPATCAAKPPLDWRKNMPRIGYCAVVGVAVGVAVSVAVAVGVGVGAGVGDGCDRCSSPSP